MLTEFLLQVLAPTEKPTPIKSPTLQVLEYGEAVALYNFNADLPVELSFRKVSHCSLHLEQGSETHLHQGPDWLNLRKTRAVTKDIFWTNIVHIFKVPNKGY